MTATVTTILYGWQLKDATASPAVDAADKVVFLPLRAAGGLSPVCSTVTASAYPDVPTDGDLRVWRQVL